MKDWKYKLFVKFADQSVFEGVYERVEHAYSVIRDTRQKQNPTFIQLDMDYVAANGLARSTTLKQWRR
jgi:hypothetical protein